VTTILVVDDDLGFLAYLCMTLTEAGYTAVPAPAAERAIPTLRELDLGQVDLLVVNLRLTGAASLAEVLRSRRVKIIGIEDPRVTGIKPGPADGILRRPLPFGQAESEWLRTVRRVLGEAA
jgi:DNA-binding response OmpR family regulator